MKLTKSELDECLYYIVRADHGGIPEQDKYFNAALDHIRGQGLQNIEMYDVELRALINAARRRDRLAELDEAVKGGEESC